MNMKRRTMLKGALIASAAALTPQAVLAAWPKEGFGAKSVPEALMGTLGSDSTSPSDAIKIKAPDIAENGAVVPVTVSTTLADVTSISILASANPSPLAASFDLGAGAAGFVSTRIKMGKTGDIVAVVKSGGSLHSNRKGVKVTIGGCGG